MNSYGFLFLFLFGHGSFSAVWFYLSGKCGISCMQFFSLMVFGEGMCCNKSLLNVCDYTYIWCWRQGDGRVLVNSGQRYFTIFVFSCMSILADVAERKGCIAIHQLHCHQGCLWTAVMYKVGSFVLGREINYS